MLFVLEFFNKLNIILLAAFGGCAECSGMHRDRASFFTCVLHSNPFYFLLIVTSKSKKVTVSLSSSHSQSTLDVLFKVLLNYWKLSSYSPCFLQIMKILSMCLLNTILFFLCSGINTSISIVANVKISHRHVNGLLIVPPSFWL